MSLPTSRHLRRVAVALAAATAVVLGPTACDIGLGVPDAAGQLPEPGAGTPAVAAVAVVSPQDPDADEAAADYETDDDTAAEETTAADETAADDADATDPTEDADATDDATGDADATDDTGPTSLEETPAEDADGGDDAEGDAAGADATEDASAAPTTTAPPAAPPAAGGLETLGGDCTGSDLEPHDGFQEAPRCVSIAMGEVPAQDKSPAILIVDSPVEVDAGETFEITVSSCNLVRDRFLGAAAGGYYRESSFLDANGFVRGHFHTAVQALTSTTEAPDSAPVPAFFLATQDNGGGEGCDDVAVPITVEEPGSYRISTWAGDGSHRTPMMQRANQTPAFDTVRLTVN